MRKPSERAVARAKAIKKGLCGTCKHRKLAKGKKECRTCLNYYAKLARKAAKAAKKSR